MKFLDVPALATVAIISAAMLPACVEEKGDEDDVPTDGDGKDDSHRRPTDHGELAFATSVIETISDTARFHAWQFELSGDAEINAFTTYAVRGQRRLDTVMYLYKESASGWGPYIARNDNDGDRVYSRLVRQLGAGRYRVLVKGYASTTRGRFAVQVNCEGAGCAPVATETCLLAATYPELRADPAYSVSNDRYITASAQLEPLEVHQTLATFRAIYGDVDDFAAGLAMIDAGSLRFTSLIHNATNTELSAVEFGAGDTSVGLIFYGWSLQIAGRISDSSIEDCNWFAPRSPGQSAAGEMCRAGSDCVAGLRCEGVFANAGVCIAPGNPAGEGNECASDAACGNAGLVCAGVTRGYGLCRPAWMRATFTDASSTAVPDGNTLVRAIAARGLATVDADVVLSLRVAHPRASQLRVTLTNPAGAEVLVHDGVAADNGAPLVLTQKVIIGFSGDEMVNGEWTLRVTDRTSGYIGTLESWQLTLTSRYD
ncbi:MAG: proprotein convertase P-domain-containing protein [Kofleriaceae bacterium]